MIAKEKLDDPLSGARVCPCCGCSPCPPGLHLGFFESELPVLGFGCLLGKPGHTGESVPLRDPGVARQEPVSPVGSGILPRPSPQFNLERL